MSQLSTGLPDQERRAAPQRTDHSDDCVMSVQEWATRARLSYPTARRVIAAGEGPVVTRLSPNRVGITFGAHRAWLKSRAINTAAA
jgi:hypothetical protein